MQGQKIDIITSSIVLAADGVKDKMTFYKILGINAAHNNSEEGYKDGERTCYRADIVYSSISNFQFDYLRHSFERLGTLGTRKPENNWVLLDEVDSLLIDQGSNITKLSGPFPGMESLRYIYIKIWKALAKAEIDVSKEIEKKLGERAEELQKKIHSPHYEAEPIKVAEIYQSNQIDYENFEAELAEIDQSNQIDYENFEAEFAESFLKEIKSKVMNEIGVNKQSLLNEKIVPSDLHKYVEKSIGRWIKCAFAAKYQFSRDKEYKVDKKDGEDVIIPVDNTNTGVSMKNTILSNAMHQFLQIKENLCLTFESLVSCYVSNLGYVRKYGSNILGLRKHARNPSVVHLFPGSFV